MPTRRSTVVPLVAVVLGAVIVAQAQASTKPTGSEAKAIERAFLKGREGETTIQKIRLSSEDPDFAAVYYTITIEEVRRAPKTYKPPSPAILQERKGKWKPTAKPPKKVGKELKGKPKSEIRISGDVTATLTQPASCTQSKDFYSAGIYDRGADIYLSIQIFNFAGFHSYPALGVRSVATLAVGNGGGPPHYETGQGNNAEASSGEIYVDGGRWGIIEAGMAKIPDENTYPLSVTVSGIWDCR